MTRSPHSLVNLEKPFVLLALKVTGAHIDEIDHRLGGDEVAHMVLDELDLGVGPIAIADRLVLRRRVGGEGVRTDLILRNVITWG